MKLRRAKKVIIRDTRWRAEHRGQYHRAALLVRRAMRRGSRLVGRDAPVGADYYVDDGGGMRPAGGLHDWALWFEDVVARRLAHTTVGTGGVSTVGLGLDHGYGRGRPILYESAVFTAGADGRLEYEPEERYSTRKEARDGHARLVARLVAEQEQRRPG